MAGKVVHAGTSGIGRSQTLRDIGLEIAEGHVHGHAPVFKFGRNSNIANATTADIWDGGAVGGESLIWVAPTVARIHNISSDNAADTAAGGGCRTLTIYGLTDWDTPEVSETVTMNGTSDVATANAYVIIHRLSCTTWGATDVNVGTLSATAVTDGTVTAQIGAGNGQTQMVVYGIPSTQSLYVFNATAVANKGSGSSATGDMRMLYNPRPDIYPPIFKTVDLSGISSDTSGVSRAYPIPVRMTGPAILKIQIDSNANGFDISAAINAVLVDNDH